MQFNTSRDVNVGVIPGGIKPDGTLKWKRVVNTTMLAFNPDIGLTGDNIYHSVVTGSSYNRVSANINDYALFENSFFAKNGAKAFHWGAVRARTCKDIYINHPEETTFTSSLSDFDYHVLQLY